MHRLTRTTTHLCSCASVAPSQSVVGAYPGVVMVMEQSGAAPAPAATRSSVPSTGPVTGESYTDMLMAHLSSSDDMMSPASWNYVPYPGSSATAPPSVAVNGVATAYRGGGGLNINAVVTMGPETRMPLALATLLTCTKAWLTWVPTVSCCKHRII